MEVYNNVSWSEINMGYCGLVVKTQGWQWFDFQCYHCRCSGSDGGSSSTFCCYCNSCSSSSSSSSSSKWLFLRPAAIVIHSDEVFCVHAKKSFIDVFYHQIRNGIQRYTTRAPPVSLGGRVRTGDQTISSPTPWPFGHDIPIMIRMEFKNSTKCGVNKDQALSNASYAATQSIRKCCKYACNAAIGPDI